MKHGAVENKQVLNTFYTAYSLYIADKFYTFVMFSSIEKTVLSEINDKKD